MSVGEEEGKGTHLTREVFKVLEGTGLNFVGNVEGSDVYSGELDVIVCDGFVGNVMLKSSEALGEMIARLLEQEMRSTWRTKLGYLFARPAFKRFMDRLDYSEYGAAQLLGVKGGCFIGHGVSNAKAVKNAVLRSSEFCEAELHQKMREKIAEMHLFEERLESPRPQEVV
jgi:glycerol-3-phosphate acyltransferase PlsX